MNSFTIVDAIELIAKFDALKLQTVKACKKAIWSEVVKCIYTTDKVNEIFRLPGNLVEKASLI